MRPQHLIAATKSDAFPGQVICLDCDYEWTKEPRLRRAETARLVRWMGVGFGGASGVYGEGRWAEGETAEGFWDAIFRQVRRGGSVTCFSECASMVWALLDLWGMVERREVDICGADERDSPRGRADRVGARRVRAVLENPPFILSIRKKPLSGTVKIVDVANYGLQPSGELSSSAERVRRVAAFVQGMVAALQLNGLGSLKDTVGSQAAFSFRRRHLTHLMEVHNDERALNLEGGGYYGGRCEAFRLGRIDEVVYHLDVSSMYPFCAGACDVPVSLGGYVDCGGSHSQDQLGAGCGLIADVTIETDEPAYPLRCLSRNVVVYPVGVYRTVLAGPELQDALLKDRVTRWHSASWYEMKPALRSYSECVLGMREKYADDDDMRDWVKGLGVCLIGKFGQRDRRWIDATSNVFHGPWATWWEKRECEEWARYRSIAGYTQTEVISSWNYDAIPAIAAWVCSLARMRLLSMMRCASLTETYYCDTDALMVSHEGFLRLNRAGWVREGEPGFLRVKNVSDSVDIHGVKSYDEEGRSVRAGQPMLSAGISAGQSYYWTRRSAAGACREGRAPHAVRIAVPHDRAEAYKHGEVCADGTVTPFQLDEG